MARQSLSSRPRRRGLLWLAVVALIVAAAGAAWYALWLGPPPAISISTSKPAIGQETQVVATFAVPSGGLGAVSLHLVQGGRDEVLAKQDGRPVGPFAAGPRELELRATVGAKHQAWLDEGTATLRAVAARAAGPLRSPAPATRDVAAPVRLRPPQLEVLSRQHYVTEGGSGAVVVRVGKTATVSGVQAGDAVSLSYPLPGGPEGERFVIFAVPWNVGKASEVRAFAEDDAGNRVEQRFLDIFKPSPPREGTVHVDDAFLERVVPAITANTPSLKPQGSLLEQYLEINGTVRRENLAEIAALASSSVPRFLWSGAFQQLPDSAVMSPFAERRTYLYDGRVVDHQTHLGLDLASTSHAPVPAANSGRILRAGWIPIYGNAVIIDHGYGLMSLYGHLSSVAVKDGEEVRKGQVVGHTGATGLAGGDHLHFEIFVQGTSVNPLEWLDGAWISNRIASKVPLPGK